jgi:arylsulfatase
VDDKEVARGRIENTIRSRFSLDETMDFGEDTGTPVVEDYVTKMPFKFTGELTKFVIRPVSTTVSSADERERR